MPAWPLFFRSDSISFLCRFRVDSPLSTRLWTGVLSQLRAGIQRSSSLFHDQTSLRSGRSTFGFSLRDQHESGRYPEAELAGILHEPSRDSVGFRKWPVYVNRGYRVTAHYRLSFSALVATRLVNCISSLSYPIVCKMPARVAVGRVAGEM